MAIRADREYRMLQLLEMQFRAADNEEEQYIVEGYATTFDDPYVLYSFDGKDYKEQIARDALTGTQMDDVIFLYNHEGMVFARISNGTLQLDTDEHGLHVRADLSSTEDSRRMFESIKAGLVTQMSWAFTVDDEEYDEKTRTRTIKRVKRMYDVSAVSIPANDKTDISARSYWDGVIAEEARREAARKEKVERIKNLLKGETDEH